MSEEQGRNADILQSIVDGTEYTDPPQSRIEDLLLQVKEVIEDGGGTKIRLPRSVARWWVSSPLLHIRR